MGTSSTIIMLRSNYTIFLPYPLTPGNIISYPNPTVDILNIEIEYESTDINYDIMLYDSNGNMRRQQQTQGGIVQFDVSNLPNGTYYLHIYDGINEMPEMRQIVIEH
jgi:hypothetical protein